MRRRIYYTDRQITKNLYTLGKEWQFETGEEYVGPYHTYTTGEVFTQSEWNSTTSKKLVEYKQIDENVTQYRKLNSVKITNTTVNSAIVQITNENRVSGFVTRYIAKKYNETKIIETDIMHYELWLKNKIDKNLWDIIPVEWKISGPITSLMKNEVLTLGVRETNTNTVANLETRMPGISAYLNNPIQYYTDTDFIVPRDINS